MCQLCEKGAPDNWDRFKDQAKEYDRIREDYEASQQEDD